MLEKPSKPIFYEFDWDMESRPKEGTKGQRRRAQPGLITLRMSKRAKRRIVRLHKSDRTKQDVFREMLAKSDLLFTPEQLEGHDCKASLNVVLNAAQLKRLDDAAEAHNKPRSTVTSALVIEVKL